MADLTAHNSELTLPELVRFTLEHMRNLRLKGPSTLKDEHYAMIWRALSTASNKLVETIEELRFKGQEQWETGDDASYQQFGNISVPQGKEFLRDVIRELASLGTKWHTSSTSASIDTQRFDPDHVPRLVEFEAVIEDGKVEDVEPEDFKKAVPMKEAVKKDSTAPEFIKTEAIEPSPQDPVLSSIESKSIHISTSQRPA